MSWFFFRGKVANIKRDELNHNDSITWGSFLCTYYFIKIVLPDTMWQKPFWSLNWVCSKFTFFKKATKFWQNIWVDLKFSWNWLNFRKESHYLKSFLAHILGYVSQSEKVSEIKPPFSKCQWTRIFSQTSKKTWNVHKYTFNWMR